MECSWLRTDEMENSSVSQSNSRAYLFTYSRNTCRVSIKCEYFRLHYICRQITIQDLVPENSIIARKRFIVFYNAFMGTHFHTYRLTDFFQLFLGGSQLRREEFNLRSGQFWVTKIMSKSSTIVERVANSPGPPVAVHLQYHGPPLQFL